MSRCETYSTVPSYIVDLIGNHNNRIVNQPNAINHTGDYVYQVSALTAMQATFPSLFRREFFRGPFVFNLTDMHQSNIFIDDDWHITCLVDLEWACSRPIEMIRTPTWLTNQACDEIAEDTSEYNKIRSEFIDIMANEEMLTELTSENISLSEIMNRSWETGTFWFSLVLASPTGIFSVFYKQIQPRFMDFCPSHHSTDNYQNFLEIMPWYWSKDLVRIAARKKQDRKGYDDQLKAAFGISEE
ncbi:uncharacterized protein N7483_000342 [Penicillium malachiteum]|uniref:uncharacterized protein n=1 Tax=Penicillium malachiteum TaxID=1324776 RepID=UPI002548AEBA|nr:uncharacterized protein N7483_000342 [Penicillium malachiteum]KAJ5735217.1 hypothetical protein N7483_000342 [Penicillium malachiteum]